MISLRSRLATIPAIALATATAAAAAQSGATATPRIVQSAGVLSAAQNHRDIPLATARAIVAAHHPDVIDGSLDPAMLTFLLDSNNGYITSVANRAAVVVRAADGSVAAAAGGFAVAGGTVRAAPSASTAPASASIGTGSGSINIAGIGPIDAALVDETFWINYAAGDLGPNAVRVRYVILKNAPNKLPDRIELIRQPLRDGGDGPAQSAPPFVRPAHGLVQGAISAYEQPDMGVRPPRIEDYALIGDCETAALVSRGGSIDWLCWPRFDSDACFAALLGGPENGHWRIAPVDENAAVHRAYRGDTMILETDFETPDGCVTVIDFMPLRDSQSNIVRTVVGNRGRVRMATEIVIRFDYGSTVPWMSRLDDGTLRAIAGPYMLVIRSDVELRGKDFTTVGEFTVGEGERVSFVMTLGPSHLDPPTSVDPARALDVTEQFWKEWAGQCTYRGRWRDAVMRSVLTLKALSYAPTGGIVAAPTTSLPEQIGGVRNWDYRYCWLRDATLSLAALMDAGYYHEAAAWRDWLLRACAGIPAQAQIMYGLGGERLLAEWEVTWLPGYENSKPVRVGNAAHGQIQLDVYGEVMSALHQARAGGIAESVDAWELQKAFADHVVESWRMPDHGLWEVRGDPQQFTHSKVMAWVALDRAVQSAEQVGLDGRVDRWREARDTIHEDVCRNGFDANLNAFVQAYGSKLPDASLLALPLVGFLPADDPRVRGTLEFIERRLLVDGFVLRYESDKTDDGLPAGEGAFLACSFWLAENYALQQRHDEAVRLFERLLALRNDVGLLAEQYSPRLERQVGNFPQAFSHIALLLAAFKLDLGRELRQSPGSAPHAAPRETR